jgi:hypothetical protein
MVRPVLISISGKSLQSQNRINLMLSVLGNLDEIIILIDERYHLY